GSAIVSSGGVASGTTVRGGELDVGGTARGTIVSALGVEYISPGGVDSGATLLDFGTEYVLAGGTASGAAVSGGTQNVRGTAIDTVLTSGAVVAGGIQNVSS